MGKGKVIDMVEIRDNGKEDMIGDAIQEVERTKEPEVINASNLKQKLIDVISKAQNIMPQEGIQIIFDLIQNINAGFLNEAIRNIQKELNPLQEAASKIKGYKRFLLVHRDKFQEDIEKEVERLKNLSEDDFIKELIK